MLAEYRAYEARRQRILKTRGNHCSTPEDFTEPSRQTGLSGVTLISVVPRSYPCLAVSGTPLAGSETSMEWGCTGG